MAGTSFWQGVALGLPEADAAPSLADTERADLAALADILDEGDPG